MGYRCILDLICQGLRRQALFARLLPNESEAMVRLLLRDPLVLPLPEDTPEGIESLSVSVIGPIALSRSDSLEAIESRIEVRDDVVLLLAQKIITVRSIC